MIESSLVDKIKVNRGLCLKFTSPSMTGLPDRIILLLSRTFDKERSSVVKSYEWFMHGTPKNDEQSEEVIGWVRLPSVSYWCQGFRPLSKLSEENKGLFQGYR